MNFQPFLAFPRRPVASSATPTLSYQTATADAGDLTTYSFSSTAIGTDTGSTRTVIVAVYGVNITALRTISTFTVGGVSGVAVHSRTDTTGGQFSTIAFYAFTGVSGTTGTVSITWSGSQLRTAIGVWAAYDLSSTTAVATGGSGSLSAPTLDVNVNADGMVLAAAHANGSSTYAWTGVTERADALTETVGWSVADASALSSASPRSVSASITGSASIANAISISLR